MADGSTSVQELNQGKVPARWRRQPEPAAPIETVMPQEVRGIIWRVLLMAGLVSGGIKADSSGRRNAVFVG